jgi:hypothetical protein
MTESPAQRWFTDLWSTGNLEVADEIIDPEYAPDWIQIPKTGPDQVKHEVRYFRSVFPDLKYDIVDQAETDAKIWIRYKATGTHLGDAWGFTATGRQATFEGVSIFTVGSSGKIIDRWGSFCFYDIFTELGLVSPWWELSHQLNIANED